MGLPQKQKDCLSIGWEGVLFVKRQEISRLTGLSGGTLKKYRLSGMLSEDVHWIRVNSKLILYNVPLVMDWIQNIHYPKLHQQTIEAYQAMLKASHNPLAISSSKR
jgi:hypothetical protein